MSQKGIHNLAPIKLVDQMVQNEDDSFTQKVEVDGKNFTITVYGVSNLEEAKAKLENELARVMATAIMLGLGSKNSTTEEVNISKDRVSWIKEKRQLEKSYLNPADITELFKVRQAHIIKKFQGRKKFEYKIEDLTKAQKIWKAMMQEPFIAPEETASKQPVIRIIADEQEEEVNIERGFLAGIKEESLNDAKIIEDADSNEWVVPEQFIKDCDRYLSYNGKRIIEDFPGLQGEYLVKKLIGKLKEDGVPNEEIQAMLLCCHQTALITLYKDEAYKKYPVTDGWVVQQIPESITFDINVVSSKIIAKAKIDCKLLSENDVEGAPISIISLKFKTLDLLNTDKEKKDVITQIEEKSAYHYWFSNQVQKYTQLFKNLFK